MPEKYKIISTFQPQSTLIDNSFFENQISYNPIDEQFFERKNINRKTESILYKRCLSFCIDYLIVSSLTISFMVFWLTFIQPVFSPHHFYYFNSHFWLVLISLWFTLFFLYRLIFLFLFQQTIGYKMLKLIIVPKNREQKISLLMAFLSTFEFIMQLIFPILYLSFLFKKHHSFFERILQFQILSED